MICYASHTTNSRNLEAMRAHGGWGLMLSRYSKTWRMDEGFRIAGDNGAWSDFKRGLLIFGIELQLHRAVVAGDGQYIGGGVEDGGGVVAGVASPPPLTAGFVVILSLADTPVSETRDHAALVLEFPDRRRLLIRQLI